MKKTIAACVLSALLLGSLVCARPAFTATSAPVKLPIITPHAIKPSGLRMSKTTHLGNFYDVVGHRSMLLGAEGGDFEAWVYPFKAIQNGEIGFLVNGTIIWSDQACQSFTVTPECSTITYALPGGQVTQTIFAPVNEPGIAMLFSTTAKTPVILVAKVKQDMQLMWPANGDINLHPTVARDDSTGAQLVASEDRRFAALVGWTSPASPQTLPTDARCAGAIVMTTAITAKRVGCLVITGSNEGIDAARASWIKLATHPYKSLQATASYYTALDADTLSIATPDANLDAAFRWAKVGLDKCYKVTPKLGAGIVAGFDRSWDSSRPGYAWYFGRDSIWCQFSLNAYGQFAKAKDNLELLSTHQLADGANRGKIYHEMSPAHYMLSGAQCDYAYPGGDGTAFYVIALENYLRWTGDLAFVKAHWAQACAAMDWCYRMDVDGDGLIDNPPAGHNWYDYGEKNMVDLVATWQRALESAATMGKLLGDARAARWAADAKRVNAILNTDFWDAKRGYFYDRKQPDSTMNTLTTANPMVPLLWNQVEPQKAEAAIKRVTQSDMTVEWGLRTNSSADKEYNADGYHEGRVWPLVTGWASLACFANHHATDGMSYLHANTGLMRDSCLAYIPEILSGDKRDTAGCPHQAWSEGMIIQPMVDGMLGLRADAINRVITFAPHFPQDWKAVTVKNVRIGKAVVDFTYTVKHGVTRITVTSKTGDVGYSVHLSPAFPSTAIPQQIRINGIPTKSTLERTATDAHLPVTALIGKRITVEYR